MEGCLSIRGIRSEVRRPEEVKATLPQLDGSVLVTASAADKLHVWQLGKAREKLARIYLSQTRMPLDEVAERLGYGEQTSFGRAFKRWTGTTPQKFRHRA